MQERPGAITFKGNPMTLVGRDVQVGDTVGDFVLLGPDLAPVTRRDLAGKVVLFNIVPSLDTGVCSAQTRRFNEELRTLPGTVEVITVSGAVPSAQY